MIKKECVFLKAEEFLNKKGFFEIVKLTENIKKSKNTGRDYKDYTLYLKSLDEESLGQDFQIDFLFNRDLHPLIDAFGDNEEDWKTQSIEIEAVLEDKYYRWKLLPKIKEELVS